MDYSDATYVRVFLSLKSPHIYSSPVSSVGSLMLYISVNVQKLMDDVSLISPSMELCFTR